MIVMIKRSALFIVTFIFYGTISGQTYQFDSNHQLVEIKYDNGLTVNLLYDANGNRITKTTSGGPLPVTSLTFNAQKSNNQVLLTWETSQEINSDKFEVEHSKEGSFFNSFATVKAVGNSSTKTKYSTIHCCPEEGVNYYRLKLIDRDGSIKYSEIRKVVFETITVMSIYPNPTSGNPTLNIAFNQPFKYKGILCIYNSVGAKIYSSIIPKGASLSQVNTRGMASGNYNVVVIVHEETYKGTFVKQ